MGKSGSISIANDDDDSQYSLIEIARMGLLENPTAAHPLPTVPGFSGRYVL